MIRVGHLTGLAASRVSGGVGGKPGRQISGATEIKQGLGESFQLLQRQGLDASGGGLAQGAAASVELAKGDGSGLGGAATGFSLGFALQAAAGFALRHPILGETGVSQVIGGEIDQGHDFLASEMGKPLPQDRENDFDKIGPWFQDPIGGAGDFGSGQHRQYEQTEQRTKPGLLAELLSTQSRSVSGLSSSSSTARASLSWSRLRAVSERRNRH